jgi:hypothetical protein
MYRPRTLVAAGIMASAVGLGAAAVAWGTSRGQPPARAGPINRVEIDHPGAWWREHDYARMTPPVRPPTSGDLSTRIVVYLKVPPGAEIRGRRIGDPPRASLAFPAGTMADRVEYVGAGDIDAAPSDDWRVADVRGTTLGDRQEEFHVLRPTRGRAGSSLLGMAWLRDDAEAQVSATDALASMLEHGAFLGPRDPDERRAMSARLRGQNDCAGCHQRERAPRARIDDPGAVNRGSDASGFFQPSTVLDDRAPLESYRPRNANAGDPFVRYACASSEVAGTVSTGGAVTCPGGEVPVAVLDVRSALLAGDSHARDLCASRRYLYERLDDSGRETFREAMAVCSE